jgi:anti-sigma B factor antagonist
MTATTVAQAVHVGPRCILVLTGEIDIATAENVIRYACDALASKTVIDVVIDASSVTFIDSTGVGALIAIRDAAAAQGAGIRLCGASANVQKVLAIMGLSATFGLPHQLADDRYIG